MADYSARFHEKFILKKSIIFVKLKKQNVVCAHEFSWSVQYSRMCTYDVLGILALISGAIFVENNIFSKSDTAYFSALFHEKIILKECITFIKVKKQNVVCAHEFSWSVQYSRMCTYDVLGFFGSPAK